MKTFIQIVLVLLVLIIFTGCAGKETLVERAENKKLCEEFGGTYIEINGSVNGGYSSWNCDLSTKAK